MERWHLPSIQANGKREPRVLFSRPDCRAVVIDLNVGDELGDHRLHEHAVLEVVSGRLAVALADGELECDAGMLMTFGPGETRSVRALEPSRLLLLLTPWPGEGHFHAAEDADPARMPANATVPPLEA
jgi:mannose-6-phosphate isomerase-like protein (cupin superfamily)